MTPTLFLTTVLDPGLAWCAAIPGWTIPSDNRARVELLAIAGQEADWKYTAQIGGPARGYWQFETIGVLGVLQDKATKTFAELACKAAGIAYKGTTTAEFKATATLVYSALAGNGNLATAFARMLLWCDPSPLPAVGDESTGWDYYDANWQPGAPSTTRWSTVYPQALAAVKANPITPAVVVAPAPVKADPPKEEPKPVQTTV